MKVIVAAVGMALVLGLAGSAFAQGQVEVKTTTPEKAKEFRIEPQGPAARELTRTPESTYYPLDNWGRAITVPYNPAFVEPFVGTTEGGTKVGLSGWTAPATPVGSLVSNYQPSGWFAIGITFIWDTAPPAKRPTPAPR